MINFSEKTEDGYEKMLQVNYLGHFIIIAKLFPIMRHSGDDCRILLMSSDAHRSCSFDLNTMNYEGNPSRFGRLDYYGRSKLYQVDFNYFKTNIRQYDFDSMAYFYGSRWYYFYFNFL